MIVTRVLDFIGYRSLGISERLKGHQVHPPDSWGQYIKKDPYEMRRVTYLLDENSLVVDVGGLRGEWASRIYCRYSCFIDIYEPHPLLSGQARRNFRYSPKVSVYDFGLGDNHGIMKLYGDDIYASLIKNECENVWDVHIERASDVFREKYSDRKIDLLKMNIEGSEYDVLPDLIQNFNMEQVMNLQVQFHVTVPDYKRKRDAIRTELAKTHFLAWNYDYLYESWRLR